MAERLKSRWAKVEAIVGSDDRIKELAADIVTLTADELVLSLKLKGGAVEERYSPAPASYVCPDMPKS